jgi:hypothetical protein
MCLPPYKDYLERFAELVLKGIEFEVIDGDLTQINEGFLRQVMATIEEKEQRKYKITEPLPTYVVSIIGP